MGIKIMIIEDDLIIAENLKENLEELGYEVTGVARNYKESVTLYEKSSPDLCLVDIHLTDSINDGIDTVNHINQERAIPIILLTSYHDNHSMQRALGIDAAAYLIKPASKTQISVAIELAISKFFKEQTIAKVPDSDSFFLKSTNKYRKVRLQDIIYLEASGSYCILNTINEKYTLSINLKNLLTQLSYRNLERCHRSFAVNIDAIQSYDEDTLQVMQNDELVTVSMSRKYRDRIMGLLITITTNR